MDKAIDRPLSLLASLRLTVALLGMCTFLVFAGTVAQVDQGIWTVVDEYFRCAFARIELRIFFPRDWDVSGGFWFPGGWLIAGLLLVNLLAAHLRRIRVKVSGTRLAAGLGVLAIGAVLTGLVIAGVFDQDVAATESAAFWRVLMRLVKGGGVAVVLMIGCMLVFQKRAGIVLLHGGIALLIISEFIAGAFAVEGRMRIEAGQAMNYVEHLRSVELAFIDRSDPEQDRISVVPMRSLAGTVAGNDELPLDITTVSFMTNSRVLDAMRAGGTVPNPATAGAGLIAIAVEEPQVSGADAGSGIDVPAAYVTIARKDGGEIGTYLVTPWLENTSLARQVVEVDGRSYDLVLRFARTYKPYSIDLVEFRHDKYVGTETPKNFSSVVRLVDAARGVDRTVKIWMNNPLRYGGETFYQSSFEPGKEVTILQVVKNRGWMIPYLSCMIVGAGMTLHMGRALLEFLRKRAAS